MRKVTYIRAPEDLSPQLRGFYERVAIELGVDAAYVREVALGESQSARVEEGLRNELTKIFGQGIQTPSRHEAQFYSDDRVLLDRLVPFVASALKRGDAAVIVAASALQESLLQRLKSDGLNVDAAIKAGKYVAMDAIGTLPLFMVNDMPEPSRFFRIVGGLLAEAVKTAKTAKSRTAVFGEWVSVLCKRGQVEAAIRLEQLGNQLVMDYDVEILCGYQMSCLNCEEHNHHFKSICAEHSVVYTQGE